MPQTWGVSTSPSESGTVFLTSVRVLAHLVAVHHVPEAGQRVDPNVNVLMLDSSHGELQGCNEVAAAGCQLEGKQKNKKKRFMFSKQHLSHLPLYHHHYNLRTNLLVILQNRVNVF